MTRLVHGPEAYLRSMQISQNRAFLFLEGRDPDPYVYGKLARKSLESRGISFQLCRAEEISGAGTGGKQALLRFFNFLSSRAALGGDFKGKRWFTLFFLDKDVDDLLGLQVGSPHIHYTTYYDIENHIYAAGNLAEAVAASTSIDIAEVPPSILDSLHWRTNAAHLWRDWVFLCLLVARLGVSCAFGYALKSTINAPPNAQSAADLAPILAEIQHRSGLADGPFNAIVDSTRAEVQVYYGGGRFDIVFKGKWYAAILNADVITHLAGKPANRVALEARLTPAIAQSLDPNGAWANSFTTAMDSLLATYI